MNKVTISQLAPDQQGGLASDIQHHFFVPQNEVLLEALTIKITEMFVGGFASSGSELHASGTRG